MAQQGRHSGGRAARANPESGDELFGACPIKDRSPHERSEMRDGISPGIAALTRLRANRYVLMPITLPASPDTHG
ncbi:hypothetical protein BJ123_1505 [Rhodopseudomonas thermotolerans]|uniref:Uncharacterized protein n=2 Tax=Rhodopseudomonas TaxID=1073 RepID=A0A336JZ64_9BRAD|nr:hypothetical protein BJ125_1505 [Rhodopseudomonas pentothenatexigens]REF86868.1 hypothetical protein BJ123_1505 [Rhodopseudomonas thermotolerans]SSW93716.1 hypothetical protein SAMN05892882_1505 [Rhodopseudomonas pentothenatexigens]